MSKGRARRWVKILAAVVVAGGLTFAGVTPAMAAAYNAPQLVADAPASPFGGTTFQGKLLLNGGDSSGIRRLYSFDGSTFTQLSDTIVDPVAMTLYRNDLYFFGFDSIDLKYRLYRFDGNTITATDQWTSDAGNQAIVLGNDLILAEQWGDESYYLVRWTPEGGAQILGTYAFITDMVNYQDKIYFTNIASPGGDYALFATNGVTTVFVQGGRFGDPLVFDNDVYVNFSAQNFAIYKMDATTAMAPATYPNVEYTSRFTDGGDVMYFTADNLDVSQGLYAYHPNSDGSPVTSLGPIAGSPNRVENLTMWDGLLFFTGDTSMIRACSVGPQSCGRSGSIYTYASSTQTLSIVADSTGWERDFVVFNNALYFSSEQQWFVITKPTSLADTGVSLSGGVLALTLLIASGLTLLALRRRVDS